MATITPATTAAKMLTLCCILFTIIFLQSTAVSAFSSSPSLPLPFLRTIKHASSTTLAVSLTPPSEKRDDSQQQQQENEQKGGLEEDELIDMIASSLSPTHKDQQQQKSSKKATELWLDLRKTAIVPTPLSLSHLFSDDEETRKQLEKYRQNFMLDTIDYILVSEHDLDRVLKAQKFQAEEEEDGNYHAFMEQILDKIICETEDGSIVTVSDASSPNSNNEIGKVMVFKENEIVLDPIFAMDTVTAGKWVLVDDDAKSGKNDEKERTEAITSLIEFIGGVISSSPSSPLLHLHDDANNNTNNDEGSSDSISPQNGGIALVCKTKKDVFQAGVSVQSLLCQSAVEMTESGILLPHIMEREEAEFEEGVVDATIMDVGGGIIKSAVVLPFDAMLWKNTMIVFGDDENGDDGSDSL